MLSEDARGTVQRAPPNSLDLVFADGGVGKHVMLDETLALLRPGGIYICDDMKPHPMWPPEHAVKIPPLMEALARRQDFRRTYIDWSSSVVVMVKLAK
jgi:predicted O-methyltransferase YrrM